MKRTVWHDAVAILLVILAFLGGPKIYARIKYSATSSTCTVDLNGGSDYTTVHDALNEPTCRQIDIAPGTYFENLIIQRDVAIHGVSQDKVILDGSLGSPVLNILDNTRVDATGLTIQRGTNGILNRGTLVITDSTITRNSVHDIPGAGILNIHKATLVNVTLSGNTTGLEGGGIYGDINTETVVIRSTLRDNVAGRNGDGMYIQGDNGHIFSYLTVSDSTIYNSGTAILGSTEYSVIHITNSTLTHNNIGLAPSYGGQFTVSNTIIADNNEDCTGSIISAGHNIEDTNTCGLQKSSDHPNTNPQLGPMQNNGGTTETRALLPGSPAIDAGSNTDCPNIDQRGQLRPIDGDADLRSVCDIGAYEYNPFGALSLSIANLSTDSVMVGAQGFTLTINGQNFVNGAILQWNGNNQPTMFVNSTQLQALISASDVAKEGTVIVRISNPDGLISNGIEFTIRRLRIYLPLTQR